MPLTTYDQKLRDYTSARATASPNVPIQVTSTAATPFGDVLLLVATLGSLLAAQHLLRTGQINMAKPEVEPPTAAAAAAVLAAADAIDRESTSAVIDATAPLVISMAEALHARECLAYCLPRALAVAAHLSGVDLREQLMLPDDAAVSSVLRAAASAVGETEGSSPDFSDAQAELHSLVPACSDDFSNVGGGNLLARHAKEVAAAAANVSSAAARLAAACQLCLPTGAVEVTIFASACNLRDLLNTERGLAAAATSFLERGNKHLSAAARSITTAGSAAEPYNLLAVEQESLPALTDSAVSVEDAARADSLAQSPSAGERLLGTDPISAAVLAAARGSAMVKLAMHSERMEFDRAQNALIQARAERSADARAQEELAAYKAAVASRVAIAAAKRRQAAEIAAGTEARKWAHHRAANAKARAAAAVTAHAHRCWDALATAATVAALVAAFRVWPLLKEHIVSQLTCDCALSAPSPSTKETTLSATMPWGLLNAVAAILRGWRSFYCVCWAQLVMALAVLLLAWLRPPFIVAMFVTFAAIAWSLRPLAAAALASLRSRAVPLTFATISFVLLTLAPGLILRYANTLIPTAQVDAAATAASADADADVCPWHLADALAADNLELELASMRKAALLQEFELGSAAPVAPKTPAARSSRAVCQRRVYDVWRWLAAAVGALFGLFLVSPQAFAASELNALLASAVRAMSFARGRETA